jgi:hypothetical protein
VTAVIKLIYNVLAFEAGWFICVAGAANGYPLAGPVAVMVLLTIHLLTALQPRAELMLILTAGVVGACFDSLLLQTGWLSYPNGIVLAGLAPYWIVAMWLLFATTLNVSLRWLRGRYPLAVLLGLLGGPLSYYAGAGLGGVELLNAPYALTALALGWAVIMPALVWLSERMDGMRAGEPGVQHA